MLSLSVRCALAFAGAMVLSPAVHADDALWKLLQGGGQVVLMRHAVTDPGVGDPEGMRLDDCATQRNLSAQGIAHARRIGDAWRERKAPVGRVLASPWCRTLETARLAFGGAPQPAPALGNLFGRPEAVARQVAQMKLLVGGKTLAGHPVKVRPGPTNHARRPLVSGQRTALGLLRSSVGSGRARPAREGVDACAARYRLVRG